MHLSTTLLAAGLASLALAGYTVQDDYSGDHFFSMFTFDTEDDPTHGYVNYVDQNTAQGNNLISVDNGVVTIRSDSTNVASGRGRNSVRVTSTKQYTHGLVVLDLEHMPGSACGVWPAFWMTGPNWPNSGEIDILEGVNLQSQNAMTMHTNAGCTLINKDCQGSTGCGTESGGPSSFGDGFNNINGGVYAMEWTSSAINIWFFPRSSIPAGATGTNPDPSTWGAATASFQGGNGCTIDDHFQNNNIVFDTTFCGDWAGSIWGQDSTCSAKAASCQDYVQNHPEAFKEAYWTINSLKVYTDNGNANAAQANAVATPSAPQAAASLVAQSSSSSTTPSSATPTPISTPSSAGNVNASTSNPNEPATETATKGKPLSETADGTVQWGAGRSKRDIDTSFNSVAEQPAVTERGIVGGESEEEIQIVEGKKTMRHLRRHRLATGMGGRHSH